MTQNLATLPPLKRPPLLVRAARFALTQYDRDRDLGAILGQAIGPASDRCLAALVDREHDLNAQRKAGVIDYDAGRHIRVLTALMGELQALRGPASVPRLS